MSVLVGQLVVLRVYLPSLVNVNDNIEANIRFLGTGLHCNNIKMNVTKRWFEKVILQLTVY